MPRAPSSHAGALILRVLRPAGRPDELYVAGGLTIGRAGDNAVVLAGDPAVDRAHARVEVAGDGRARLRCVGPGGTLSAGGAEVAELPLHDGVRFHIGRTEFECVDARRDAGTPGGPSRASCPSCGRRGVDAAGEGPRPCPACGAPVLPVRPGPPDPGPLLLPAAYGGFRAGRLVARGGMGLVLEGCREGDGAPVAIKVFPPAAGAGRPDAEAFGREAAMLAAVRHPHVVGLLGHGASGAFRYIVLEWVGGPSLRRVIAEAHEAGAPTPFATAARWLEQAGRGLAAVHAAGLVHRDVKPSNILIGSDGEARLADLGIATRAGDDRTACTTAGRVAGTFAYAAPEQLAGDVGVDGRADLYSLATTFYELLTGARPVGAWGPASGLNPTVPRSFDRILARALAPRPSDRYRDADELLAALADVVAAGTNPPGPGPEAVAAEGPRPGPPASGAASRESPGPVREALRSAAMIPNMAGIGALVGLFVFLTTPRLHSHGLAGVILFPAGFSATSGVLTAWYWTLSFPFLNLRRWLLGGAIVGGCFEYLCTRGLGSMATIALASGPLGMILRLALSNFVDGPESYRRWAAAGRAFDHDPMVVACLTRAILLDPADAAAHALRGEALARRGDHAGAALDHDEAVRLAPDSAEAHAARGRMHRLLGDHARAVADFDRAIRLEPGCARHLAGRAEAHQEAGDHERAIEDFTAALRLEPGNAGLHSRRAASCEGARDPDPPRSGREHPRGRDEGGREPGTGRSTCGQLLDGDGEPIPRVGDASLARPWAPRDDPPAVTPPDADRPA